MADLSGFNFNAEEVEPRTAYEPLPAGWYVAMITDSEMRQTRSGGQMLQLRLDIVEGDYENRVIYDRLNLIHDNPDAVEIAQRTLSSICRAVGIMQPKDSEDLHDVPLRIKLAIRPASNGYEASNNVKAYEPVKSAAPGVAKPRQAAPNQAAPAAPARPKKPWE